MTDKDIIKALECCNTQNCADCPLYNGNSFSEKCKAICLKEVASLINRQQSEIERLRKEVNLVSIQFQDLQERYEEEQAEIERLEKIEIEIDDFCRRLCRMRMLNGNAIASYEDLQNYIQEEKSEAIKEFAERLKKSDDFYDCIRAIGNVDKIDYMINIIDNLVKEMVGENNG